MPMTGRYDYSGSFGQRAVVALQDVGMRQALAHGQDLKIMERPIGLESLKDAGYVRDIAARIRDYNLTRLDEHLRRLAETWRAAGGTVFFAGDAAEARDYVVSVARAADAKTAVKVKSMVTEEIELNEALEQAGIEAVETDIGQYIVQLAGEPPSHIVAPSIHMTTARIGEVFSSAAGRPLPNDARALTDWASASLRDKFLAADVGISGVNLAVADEGTLALVTNEGNGRMCTSLPRVHIAVMGMERVVWDFDQLAVILSLLARSNTGQKFSQYTSLLHGPRRSGESDGPLESHLVILDNGRSGILGTRYQSALRCIRCGACLNNCPVFRQVGGHAYDPVYSGPIGAVITPLLKGMDEAGDLAHASTLCGKCTEVCPVKIPLHDLLLYVRQDSAHAAGRAERAAYSAWSFAWANPSRFAWSRRATAVLRLVTRGRSVRRLPVPVLGRWTRGRTLPGTPRTGSDGAARYDRAR
jgi:L-lactate dehydrogenase complex protein LldF